ncbi:MAG: pseudouridine synthase [Ferrimicrobium sp.]
MRGGLTELVGERLQKVLSRRGYGSRRVCEDLIIGGRVRVNGAVAVVGMRVTVELDYVEVDGAPVGAREDLVYYLLNKPVGVISSAKDTHGRLTVVSFLPPEPRVYPVGRLDADSEGLIILTNDGELASYLMHPRHSLEREYLVTVDGTPQPGQLARLRRGVEDDGECLSALRVGILSPGLLRIVLTEGKNRQIRRMCAAIGFPVQRLIRTRIGTVRDPRLASGSVRPLTSDELITLRRGAGILR